MVAAAMDAAVERKSLYRYTHRLSGARWIIRHGEVRIERISLSGRLSAETVKAGDVAGIEVDKPDTRGRTCTISIRLRTGQTFRSPTRHDENGAGALRAEIVGAWMPRWMPGRPDSNPLLQKAWYCRRIRRARLAVEAMLGGKPMFEGWDAVVLARAQFAFTMSFHIVFPAFSIGLASYLAVLEALWLWTGREVFINLFNYWLKIFAIAFGMGVVSGIVMSYQFGTNWSAFADKAGPIIGR
jgi:hypothetical protein